MEFSSMQIISFMFQEPASLKCIVWRAKLLFLENSLVDSFTLYHVINFVIVAQLLIMGLIFATIFVTSLYAVTTHYNYVF